MQITENKHNKLNPGSVTSYDLRPGKATTLVEREGMDKRKK